MIPIIINLDLLPVLRYLQTVDVQSSLRYFDGVSQTIQLRRAVLLYTTGDYRGYIALSCHDMPGA